MPVPAGSQRVGSMGLRPGAGGSRLCPGVSVFPYPLSAGLRRAGEVVDGHATGSGGLEGGGDPAGDLAAAGRPAGAPAEAAALAFTSGHAGAETAAAADEVVDSSGFDV